MAKDLEECPCGKKHPPSAPKSSKPISKRATRSKKDSSDSTQTDIVEDDWLECDYCYQWWHKECAGVLRPNGLDVDISNFSCILCLLAHSTVPTHILFKGEDQQNCQSSKAQKPSLSKKTKQENQKKKKGTKTLNNNHKEIEQGEQTTSEISPSTNNILSEYDIIETVSDSVISESKQQIQPPLEHSAKEHSDKEEEFIVLVDNIDSPFTNSVDIKREVAKFYPEVEIKHCYPLPKGGIALHTTSLDFQNILLSEWPPGAFRTARKVKSHKPLSLSTQATIVVKSVPTFLSEDEIKCDIKSNYQVEVSIKRLRYRSNRLNRPIIKITSDRETIQSWQKNGIALNKRLYPCEPIQKDTPTRCFNCQRFGHIAKFCRSEKRCEQCSEKHSTLDCPKNSTKCCNCSQEHPASSLDCPHYISRTQEIIKRRGVERQFQIHHL